MVDMSTICPLCIGVNEAEEYFGLGPEDLEEPTTTTVGEYNLHLPEIVDIEELVDSTQNALKCGPVSPIPHHCRLEGRL